ncbi:MAG: hypothetical protein ACJ8C4_06845 [Gemmataceae bacterium]
MKRALALSMWAGFSAIGFAQQPELIPIPLDPPQVITPPVVMSSPMVFERTSMYRWQYYGVDRMGTFRPRVVLDYPEPRYIYSGKVYPMLPVRQRDYSSMIVGSAQ